MLEERVKIILKIGKDQIKKIYEIWSRLILVFFRMKNKYMIQDI